MGSIKGSVHARDLALDRPPPACSGCTRWTIKVLEVLIEIILLLQVVCEAEVVRVQFGEVGSGTSRSAGGRSGLSGVSPVLVACVGGGG